MQFDESQKFSDPPLVKCPECGKKSLRKVFQPVGIVFKGSGFYATDHRSSSGMSIGASSKTEKPESEKNAEKSSSTDPVSKTESSAPKETTSASKKEAAPAAK